MVVCNALGARLGGSWLPPSPSQKENDMNKVELPPVRTVTDEIIRETIASVLRNKRLTRQEKYDRLDALTFVTWNQHPDGPTARVLDDISKAIQTL